MQNMVKNGFGGRVPPNAIEKRAPALHMHHNPKGGNAMEGASDGLEKCREPISEDDGMGPQRPPQR
jgi:hypothetical protein